VTDPAPRLSIRPAGELDPDDLRHRVVQAWHAESVVAHGEHIYPARLPGFVALAGDRIVGHASYRIDGDRCELTSIEATARGEGTGTLLLQAVVRAARAAMCRTVWLTTTNDNLDALRFYQRRGFRLTNLRQGAVDLARATLKPEIPSIGSSGIPMRDELDLELEL
jgi:ribosomal protein S18 acetylase RimI-like enzyme